VPCRRSRDGLERLSKSTALTAKIVRERGQAGRRCCCPATVGRLGPGSLIYPRMGAWEPQGLVINDEVAVGETAMNSFICRLVDSG
jgi:hypothetical protein